MEELTWKVLQCKLFSVAVKWGAFLLNKYWLRFLRFKSAKEAYSVLQFCCKKITITVVIIAVMTLW